MTVKKFTDEEIKKALECCKKDDCDNCPNNFGNCYANLAGYALDHINRYEAELEELEAEIDKQYEQAKADILGNMSDGGTSCHWCIDGHRTVAIKEFAERLTHDLVINNEGNTDYFDFGYTLETIDNLVKEMTGETKPEKTYCAVCGENGYVSKHSDNSAWSEQCPSCRGETQPDTDFPKDYSYGY